MNHIDHWTSKLDQLILDLDFFSQKSYCKEKQPDGVSQLCHTVAFCWEKKNLQIAAANSARSRQRKGTRRSLDTFNQQKCKFTRKYSKLKQTFHNKTTSVFVGQFVGQYRCPQVSLICLSSPIFISISIFIYINHTKDKKKNNAIHYKFMIT